MSRHLNDLFWQMSFSDVATSIARANGGERLRLAEILGHGLRGGTPYATLPDGSLLAAMYIKDMPALYSTVFYRLDGAPPFRVRSLSPKLCFSERGLELPFSARCGLQYASGLDVDAARNLALVSFGEFDRSMHLASLPLDQLVALARTHVLDDDGVTSAVRAV